MLERALQCILSITAQDNNQVFVQQRLTLYLEFRICRMPTSDLKCHSADLPGLGDNKLASVTSCK